MNKLASYSLSTLRQYLSPTRRASAKRQLSVGLLLTVLLSVVISFSVTAATRRPELSYGGFATAIELKYAAYSSWLSKYGMTGCAFEQWNWWGDANTISGIPNTNYACGSGHTVSTWAITKVCSKSYSLDNTQSPVVCVRPDDIPDLTKEKGTPDDDLSCKATKKTGNPINFAVGNKYQEEIDFSGSGSFPLRFVRVFNSQDGLWRHNYSTHLRVSPDNIVLVGADGRESYFALNGNIATAEPSELGRLFLSEGRWVYASSQNEQFSFDSEGRLTRWALVSGEAHTLTYLNLKVQVEDAGGNSLSFTTANGQLQPLSLAAGTLQVSYHYDSNRRLDQLVRRYAENTEQRLFHYDPVDSKLLTGITDELGIRYATWHYDDIGRAISSEHAGGVGRVLVDYNTDSSSTVTNELGKKTTYQFQVIQGVKRITVINGAPSANCPNSNSTFTYDERGLLKTHTDNKGFVTTFEYNDRGLEESRIEATGTPEARTVTTTWHPTLNLRATVTEPARITTYHYDEQGRSTGQTVTER